MIRYLTHPSQLQEMASGQTLCFPLSLLEDRRAFVGARQIEAHLKQLRKHDETTVRMKRKG